MELDEDVLTSRAWQFGRLGGGVIAPQLRLLRGGRVGLHAMDNEASWSLHRGVLSFNDYAGRATTSFNGRVQDGRIRLEGPFRPNPDIIHTLDEVRRLERLVSDEEAVRPLDRCTGGRRNLVVLRAGTDSLHPSWDRNLSSYDRTWDLCISWFQEECGLGRDPDADFEAMQPHDRKFPALWKLFGAASPFWSYDHVMFPDDDLQMSWRDINRLFELARQQEMMLAQPSLSAGSHVTHDLTRQRSGSLFRFTDFVEIMTPLFSREALRACAPTFGLSRSGFGLDHIWPKLLGGPVTRVGIIDDVAVAHTRPFGERYSVDAAAQEGHSLLQSFGAGVSFAERGLIRR